MKKILITGSNGFIGQKLIEVILQREDIELIATSLNNENIRRGNNYVFDIMDITNSAEVEYKIDLYDPDAIINTAGISRLDYCEENKSESMAINVEGLRNIIKASNRHDIHVMHLSSDFVFDGLSGPYREEDRPNPASWYGHTKLTGEQLLAESSNNWSVVRTILVYGITMKIISSNFVLWVKDSLEDKKSIRIVNDQFRMPTFADDLAKACLNIIMKDLNGVYHISGNEMMSIYEIAVRVADFYGLDKTLITSVSSSELKEKVKRPYRTGFFLDKANRDLNYVPTSFDESLKLFDRQLNENILSRNH
jgi:dTDP-4-dehydrorhamnose reductase